MEILSKYQPNTVEKKWYAFWLENKINHSEPDSKKSFTIVIPPPNITGALHMGHALNNTIQDIFIRYYKKNGFNKMKFSLVLIGITERDNNEKY